MNKFKVFVRTLNNGNYPNWAHFRIRIIYPDGSAEYSDNHYMLHSFMKPCWYRSGMTEKESIKAMKDFDRVLGYKTKLLFKF